MKVKIIGKTDSIITLNTLKTILQGQAVGFYDITTPAQENEIKILQRSGLIVIEDLQQSPTEKELPVIDKPNVPKEKKEDKKDHGGKRQKAGRPKGSKNKNTVKSEQEKVRDAEAQTQEMGAETVISLGGETKKARMKHNFAGEIAESEQTQESLRAMEKIEAEEKGEKVEDKPTIDEKKLDASEQAGRNAVISNSGKPTATKMKNSILPEADKIKEKDPFIDRPSDDDDAADSFIDVSPNPSDPSDAFVDNEEDGNDEDFIEK